MSTQIVKQTLRKYAAEVISYGFDFSNFPEVEAGEALSSPSTPAVSGLTVGTPEVTSADFYPGVGLPPIPSGKGVKVTISGGTAGATYLVVCRVATSGGATREIEGWLAVEDAA